MNEAPLPGSAVLEAVLVPEPEFEFEFCVVPANVVGAANTLLPLFGEFVLFNGATLPLLDKSLSADRQPL